VVRDSHGWAEIDAARKKEILEAIRSGRATRGPAHAEIDITDRCNVACYFCNQQDVRTKQQISYEHLVRLIDELAGNGLKSVRMSGGGDPLAHRDFGRVLDHLQARGVVVDNLTTNAALLTPEIARRLTEYRAREVVVSLNAADAADYARMMQVKPTVFDQVLKNVRSLLEARGSSAYPAVVVQFLLDRQNLQDLPRMYELGRSLSPDRIAISLVLDIPGQRIDPEILLGPKDGEILRPLLEKILLRDREAGLLQMYFPIHEWNAMVAAIKAAQAYPAEASLFPMAPSFQEKNGQCFFGWYTATIRGNGDLYPCCLLMLPDYAPLGNALNGRFVDHWNGPSFRRLREEQREVLLAGDKAVYEPDRHRVIRRQCVEHGACWLKNIYFRGDEAFYAELGRTLEDMRRDPGLKMRLWNWKERARPRLKAGLGKALPIGTPLGDWARRLKKRVHGQKSAARDSQ
jgi:MoaA/NifB/PqqE/SkfB family radical SAM enzyme